MPENVLTRSELRPDGTLLLTPALDPGRFGYRVVLEGVFTFAYTGEQFDALYRDHGTGKFTDRHSYLQWQPEAGVLESADPAAHRYVFRLPATAVKPGESAGVRVDIDHFVSDVLIPPSEVRSQMRGSLGIQVMQVPLAPPSPWSVGWVGVPAAVTIGCIGWVVRRRMAFQGVPDEVASQLARIERKCRAARGLVTRRHERLFPLAGRIGALQEAAFDLARELRSLHSSRRFLERPVLEREIAELAASRDSVRPEARAALAEKRKNLILLDQSQEAESACRLRLTRIEAVLDSACLTLRSDSEPVGGHLAEDLCRDLDAELGALREMARSLPMREPLSS